MPGMLRPFQSTRLSRKCIAFLKLQPMWYNVDRVLVQIYWQNKIFSAVEVIEFRLTQD